MTASVEDVADLAGSLAWPLVALIALLLLGPALIAALERGTLQKVGIGPLSLEFAAATAYQPTSQAAPLIDASAGPAIPSYLPNIVSELEGPPVDYVVIDLGDGQRWLASRLYIFGQLVRRMRGAKAFVFVRAVNPERVFLGTAEVESALWSVARRYPYLEATFANVYNQWWSKAQVGPLPPGALREESIRSPTGRLPGEAVTQIAMNFIASVQRRDNPQDPEWAKLGPDTAPVWEHSEWLNGPSVERLLGPALNTSRVDRSTHPSDDEIARAVIGARGNFVAIVDADGRFERLLDRMKLVELAAQRCLPGSESPDAREGRVLRRRLRRSAPPA
jgi:hypothetical protein